MSALEATLTRLHDAVDAARTNLLTLEAEPTVAMLDTASLTGTTLTEWSAARERRASLWADVTTLTELLDDFDGRRRKRTLDRAARDAELLEQLTGPTIVLSVDEVPLAERGLLGAAQYSRECSPDELLTSMSTRFEQVRDLLTRIATVWDSTVTRIAAMRADIVRAAGDLDDTPTGESLVQRLDRTAAVAISDPLAVGGQELDDLVHEIEALQRRAAEVVTLRAEFTDRCARGRDELAATDALVVEARERRQHVAQRVSGELPAAPDGEAVARLSARLDGIVERAERDQWTKAAADLATWDDDLARARADAAATIDACRTLIDCRSELRGRLDAYTVMAAAQGRAEEPAIDAARSRAERALYDAPCDLGAAAELVTTYQRMLGPFEGPVRGPVEEAS
jgi:hypothetical protein